MKKIFLLIPLLSFLGATDAFACRVLLNRTFFDVLPPKAFEQELVAKVKILSLKELGPIETNRLSLGLFHYIAETVVIEVIKGASLGSKIMVVSDFSSCSFDEDIKVGEEQFIAGSYNEQNIFLGKWLQTPGSIASENFVKAD